MGNFRLAGAIGLHQSGDRTPSIEPAIPHKSPQNPLPQPKHLFVRPPPPSRSAASDLDPRACRARRRGGESVLALFLLTVPQRTSPSRRSVAHSLRSFLYSPEWLRQP